MIAWRTERRQAPADQVLRRVAEQAEQEEVEDDDRGQRQRSRRRSAVRRTSRSLLGPLERLAPAPPGRDERRGDDRERQDPRPDQHRARRRQPALLVATTTGWTAPPGVLATGAGPGCSASSCCVRLEDRLAVRRAASGSSRATCRVRITSIAFTCTSGRYGRSFELDPRGVLHGGDGRRLGRRAPRRGERGVEASGCRRTSRSRRRTSAAPRGSASGSCRRRPSPRGTRRSSARTCSSSSRRVDAVVERVVGLERQVDHDPDLARVGRRALGHRLVLDELSESVSSSNSALTPFFVHGVFAQFQPPALRIARAFAGS